MSVSATSDGVSDEEFVGKNVESTRGIMYDTTTME
jgi:hypothetical protein